MRSSATRAPNSATRPTCTAPPVRIIILNKTTNFTSTALRSASVFLLVEGAQQRHSRPTAPSSATRALRIRTYVQRHRAPLAPYSAIARRSRPTAPLALNSAIARHSRPAVPLAPTAPSGAIRWKGPDRGTPSVSLTVPGKREQAARAPLTRARNQWPAGESSEGELRAYVRTGVPQRGERPTVRGHCSWFT